MCIEPISASEIQEVCDALQRYIALSPEDQLAQPSEAYDELSHRASRVLLIAACDLNFGFVRAAARRFFSEGHDLNDEASVLGTVTADILPQLASIVRFAEDEKGLDENHFWWAMGLLFMSDEALNNLGPDHWRDAAKSAQFDKAILCGLYYVLRFVLKQRSATELPKQNSAEGWEGPYTTKQAAEELDCSEQSVRNYAKERTPPPGTEVRKIRNGWYDVKAPVRPTKPQDRKQNPNHTNKPPK